MLDYPPPSRGPQVRQFCKAPTIGSHQNIIVTHLLTPTQRFEGSKCARLSAPLPGADCFSFPQVRVSWKALTSSSHHNFFLVFCLHQA